MTGFAVTTECRTCPRAARPRRGVLTLLIALASPGVSAPVAAQSAPPSQVAAESAPISAVDADDQDGDGVLDADDACPAQPETFNGFEDADGCPDTRGAEDLPPALDAMIPLVGPNRLLVRNAATILQSVVALLRAHPRIDEVTIEVHTDARGSAAFNLHLSQARADWVRNELVRLGIAPSRVVARGMGEYCPIDRSFGARAFQRNRRVIFRVTRSRDRRVAVQSVGCPEATAALGPANAAAPAP